MGKKKNNAIELSTSSKTPAPEWIIPVSEGEIVEGLENMRPGDLLVPRLVLMQALSPDVVAETNLPGQILNSITKEIWVDKDKEVEFIPVYHYLEWIRWGDRETGEGILERSLDPEGALAQMAMRQIKHSTSKGIDVFTSTEYHNFVSIFPTIDAAIPVVISCAKTNAKKGRKLLGLARYRGRFPLYMGKYTIKAVIESNAANQKYYTFDFANAGWINRETVEPLKELYDTLKTAFQQRKLLSHQQEELINNETEM